ncbi:uncharacterized protein LOC117320688 [Pecten maximus]|uniref:uncharacterized protein LOC117320688 n=1 Tax=Pecten maximus TaxID=6579 RepID=UPI0014588729|nr:uncharacterized protein LOC117320688 [Pecten maximus]
MAAKRPRDVIDEDDLPSCSVPKQPKCRIDLCASPDGHIYDTLKPNSNRAYECLSALTPLVDHLSNPNTFMKLIPWKIINTNADDGASFADAYCSVDLYPDAYSIALIFHKGLEILLDYIIDNRKPVDEMQAHSLEVLLHFLDQNYFTKPWSGNLMETLNRKSETDVTVFLANHFFGKLSLTPKFVINGQSKGTQDGIGCICSTDGCKMTGVFGDTGIGNPEVWHGNFDVLLNHTDTALKISIEEDGKNDHDDSPRKNVFEVKRRTSNICENDQIFAETIVFSFLQKQLHPYRKHHLYPCIAVNNENLVVYFYDSQHDVLLVSSPEPLFDQKTGHFQLATIFLSWLVVNHKCLCNGLSSDMTGKKSGFFECRKIEVFRVGLHCGQVVSPVKSSRKYNKVKEPGKEIEHLNNRRLHAMTCKNNE